MKMIPDDTENNQPATVTILNNPVVNGDDIRIEASGTVVLRLYDANGELQLTKAAHAGIGTWSVKGLPKGNYFIEIHGKKQPITIQ